MSYYDYINEKYADSDKLGELEYLKSKAITISTTMMNYHDVTVIKMTDKSILFKMQAEYGEPFYSWISKNIMKFIDGDYNRVYISMPEWFTPKAIK